MKAEDNPGPLPAVTRHHSFDPERWQALANAQRAMDRVPLGDAMGLVDAFVTHASAGVDASFGFAIVVKRMPQLDRERDRLLGVRIVEVLGRVADAERLAPHVAFLSDERTYIGDPTTARMARLAGSNRVSRLRDLFADGATSHEDTAASMRATGVSDRVFASFGLSRDCDLMLLLDRSPEAPPFEDRDVTWVVAYAGSFVRMARAVARGLGHLDSNGRLSPRERETLRYLLSPNSEKEIAAKLEVSVQTVHLYVKSIYRKFGVTNRAGLLDLWLSPR